MLRVLINRLRRLSLIEWFVIIGVISALVAIFALPTGLMPPKIRSPRVFSSKVPRRTFADELPTARAPIRLGQDF